MSEIITVSEIAAATLKSKRWVQLKMREENWPIRPGDRGQCVIAINALPPAIQKSVAEYRGASQQDRPMAVKAYSTQQQKQGESRVILIRYIQEYRATANEGYPAAIEHLNTGYAENRLSAELMMAMATAIDSRGGAQSGRLSLPTVKRWIARQKQTGHCCPETTRNQENPLEDEFFQRFLTHYQHPNNPSVWDAYHQTKAEYQAQNPGEKVLGYTAVTVKLNKLPMHVQEQGRRTGSAMKALKPCRRRDWAFLESNDVWVGDGHTFKAKVKHPDHGFAFAPEITLIMDCRSRYLVGWSFSLSENQLAVTGAIGSGMRKHGVPLSYYSDNGSGQTANSLDEGTVGLFARFGISHETGIPGNPQGRGIIERVWQVTTLAEAKKLKTYQGRDVDADTLRKVTNEINSYRRRGLTPVYVITWEEFIQRLEARFNWYNHNHRHRELKNQTPAEVYHKHLNPDTVRRLTEQEIQTLYRPSVLRSTERGEVRLYNNLYYSRALLDIPANTKVQVTYDFMDASKVWINDIKGRFVCEAEWNANRVDAFPKARIQQLKEQRIETISKRAQDKIDLARAELDGVLEGEAKKVFELPAQPPKPQKKEFIMQQDRPQVKKLTHEETIMLLYGKGEGPAKNKAAGM